MDASALVIVIRKNRNCPNCGSNYKNTDLQCTLENEIITINCKCGFTKRVDENNKEIIN